MPGIRHLSMNNNLGGHEDASAHPIQFYRIRRARVYTTILVGYNSYCNKEASRIKGLYHEGAIPWPFLINQSNHQYWLAM
jgi:hypothetical protein